jgi:carbon starvation protein
MIAYIVLVCIFLLLTAYFTYGRFLSRRLDVCDACPTPAQQINDGMDFVPAKPGLLLGQHFSAIAAAGPIVGPILAGIWFGWLPALIWIVLGSIFIGGVHDYGSLMASLRHKASSIGEVVRRHMSPTSHILFLIFVWLCLVYVIIAFTDITAQTFKTVSGQMAFGSGVAASSLLYILAAMLLGVLLYKFKVNTVLATLLFLPIVIFIVWIGPRLPAPILSGLAGVSVKQWDVILLLYCFAASIIPMWLLLQPRGYLGGWFLYLTIAAGLIGVFFGGFAIQYPAVNTAGLTSLANGKLIFPVLFITVACGACSGFHGIVSSGTTSKQISRESHARPIAYGAMLLEALVAVLALATVMILPLGSERLKDDPNLVYAGGIANFMGLMGIAFSVAFPFALLAFSTFVYDTLDVCTRLGRYIFQELFGLTGWRGSVLATLATLTLPLVVLLSAQEKAYLVAWPVFGTSNQLLASLTLLAVSVWLIKTNKKAVFAIVPMIFMLFMTLWSLIQLMLPLSHSFPDWLQGTPPQINILISGGFSIILFGLSLWLIAETIRLLLPRRPRLAPDQPAV